jgi:hypothetical protein
LLPPTRLQEVLRCTFAPDLPADGNADPYTPPSIFRPCNHGICQRALNAAFSALSRSRAVHSRLVYAQSGLAIRRRYRSLHSTVDFPTLQPLNLPTCDNRCLLCVIPISRGALSFCLSAVRPCHPQAKYRSLHTTVNFPTVQNWICEDVLNAAFSALSRSRAVHSLFVYPQSGLAIRRQCRSLHTTVDFPTVQPRNLPTCAKRCLLCVIPISRGALVSCLCAVGPCHPQAMPLPPHHRRFSDRATTEFTNVC